MKWYFYIGTLLLAIAGYSAVFPLSTEEPVLGEGEAVNPVVTEEPTRFAEIAPDGSVLRVILADQAFIDSGSVGDPKNWVSASSDTEGKKTPLRKNHAGVGYIYDKTLNAFIPPKSKDAIFFDAENAVWLEPTITKVRIATST